QHGLPADRRPGRARRAALGLGRQGDREDGALLGMAVDLNRAPLEVDERPHDGEPEAGAATAVLAADEAVEDVLELLLGHAAAGVLHRDLELAVPPVEGDDDLAALARVEVG